MPDANYLAAVDGVGADISYIVTGDEGVTVRNAEALGRECAIIYSVIEELESALDEANLKLSPQKKAHVASMLFRLTYQNGIVDKKMVDDVIALAA